MPEEIFRHASPSEEGLLKTKLYLPDRPSCHIARSRLIRRLELMPGARLTTVVAPPGYGKTTLASAWIRKAGIPAGWVSLDAKDNDPLRFWRYVSGAIGRALALPELAPPASEAGRGGVTADRMASCLLEALIDKAESGVSFILVLDDYHVIRSPDVHESLLRWWGALPSSIRMMLLSRHEIPFPLGDLRAKGRLNELDLSDLRFTGEETATYWHLLTGRHSDEETVRQLVSHTEGWGAMLRLSALAASAEDGQAAPLKALTGSSRHVADYFMEEAFGALPEETRRFLLRTSVLDRMCASLCDAVTLGSDGLSKLRELAFKGLFLVPLDDERGWYRYHHLFADFLRERLRLERETSEAELHRRAAAWYKNSGLSEEAIEHALAAGEQNDAAAWLVSDASRWLRRRETVTLRGWLDRLGGEAADEPGILLLRLWIDLLEGRTEMADVMLHKLNETLDRMKAAPGASDYPRMREEVRIIENFHAVRSGDFERSLSLIREYGRRGDLPAADTPLLLSLGLELNEGAVPFIRGAFGFNGRIGLADSYHRAYGQFIARNGLHENAYTAYQQTAMAEVCYMRNRLDEARAYAEEAIRLGRKFGAVGAYVPSVIVLSDILAAERLTPASGALLEEAMAYMSRHHRQEDAWKNKLAAAIAIRRLERGDPLPAREWAESRERKTAERRTVGTDFEDLMYIRILSGLGRQKEARAEAANVRGAAERKGNRLSELQALVLLGELYAGSQAKAEGERFLLAAVKLGTRERCYRPFLDAGSAVVEGMERYAAQASGSFTREEADFIRALAGSCLPQGQEGQVQPPGLSHGALTAREKDVLQLMSQGLSNKAIAAALVVSEGTVKLHLHRIYGKLQARGRVEALRIAERLGFMNRI